MPHKWPKVSASPPVASVLRCEALAPPSPPMWEEPSLRTAWTSQTAYMKLGSGQDNQAKRSNAPHPGRGWAHSAHQPSLQLCMRKKCFPRPRPYSILSLPPTPLHMGSVQFSLRTCSETQPHSGNNSRSDGKVCPLPGYLHLKWRDHREATPRGP